MQDERNTPQDEDAEEVEAHRRMPGAPSEEPGLADDDDEVEAHRRMPGGPAEKQFPEPSA